MSEEELRLYFDIYTNCWKMFKRFSSPADKDEFWDDLVSASQEIIKSVPEAQCEFAKQVVLATIDEIETIYKRKAKK